MLVPEGWRAVSKRLPGHYRVLRRTTVYRGKKLKRSEVGFLEPGGEVEVWAGSKRGKDVGIWFVITDVEIPHGARRRQKCWCTLRKIP